MGAPRSVFGALSDAAAAAGDVELILGWLPLADPALRYDAFVDVRALVSGWGLRRAIDAGQVHAVPMRMSTVPALLAGHMRPDLLVASVVRVDGGFAFGSEVSWQRAAVDAGAFVAAVVSHGHPHADAGEPLPADRVTVVAETDAPPLPLMSTPPSAGHHELAAQVARLVPEGARLQIGPGPLGSALLDALTVPVSIDTGQLPDGVIGLERRGLLLGEPVATYLAGGDELLAWADGRPILHRIEYAQDVTRLATGAQPFVAVNLAVEIDDQAQVNAERTADATIGGIGSHPDYALAGTRSPGGLSIVALPSQMRGRSTLVEQLSAPVSTPGHDVDVVVTERGAADLRGLDRSERRAAVRGLWR
ncbi:acetyl-CoA hydrolase/transferase C-terminal domain-containing protein [Jatrophihabitans fulvus]